MVDRPIYLAHPASHPPIDELRRKNSRRRDTYPTMSRTPSQPGFPANDTSLGEWRRRRLMAAGFDEPLAASLTQDEEAVDLHELLVLLDRGCPPELAARILAPL